MPFNTVVASSYNTNTNQVSNIVYRAKCCVATGHRGLQVGYPVGKMSKISYNHSSQNGCYVTNQFIKVLASLASTSECWMYLLAPTCNYIATEKSSEILTLVWLCIIVMQLYSIQQDNQVAKLCTTVLQCTIGCQIWGWS